MKEMLVLIAHPDDELIWMGGTILENPQWDWTIVSLCRRDDQDRMPKFKKICRYYYRAKSIISDLDDEVLQPLEIEEVKQKIKDNLPKRKYNFVFTHGKNGEYGHMRHNEIHQAVKELVAEGEIQCDKVYYFSYVPGEEKASHDSNLSIPVANKKADWIVEVSDQTFAKKQKLIKDVYGFKSDVFETISCKKKEAFVVSP